MKPAGQNRAKTRIAKAILVSVFVYLAAYGVLSVLGGYSERLYVTRHRYRFGLGIPTSQLWEPLFVKNTPWEMNVPGWIFAPCVHVDRLWWHREIDVMEFFRDKRDVAGTDGTRCAEGEDAE